jgi:hypothetical protein
MPPRVTTALWVAAYLRRVNGSGGAALLQRRGAEEAGAVFVRVDRLDGTGDLYAPASQTAYDEEKPTDRLFTRRFAEPQPDERVAEAIDRELRVDPDIWVIVLEDRRGRHFLDDALVA